MITEHQSSADTAASPTIRIASERFEPCERNQMWRVWMVMNCDQPNSKFQRNPANAGGHAACWRVAAYGV